MDGFIKIFLCFSLVWSGQVFAADAAKDDDDDKPDSEIANILNSMGYPELQVVPRASERLRMEAKEERGSWFVMHWPIELSGLVTLGVGLTSKGRQKEGLSADEKDDANTISTLTTAVGAAWLAGGLVLGGQKPYARGYRSLPKGTPKDERAALMRERLAEEALERPARVMRVLRHVSVLTNFSMNALSAVHVNDEGKVVAGVAAVLAFLPYMFEDHSVEVHEKHIEYKKKIYTPLKGASLHVDRETGKLTPMTTLAWTF